MNANIYKGKSTSVEGMRFIFMLIISLWHFSRINPFTHGYIAVDFFFILSGFFLWKSYIKYEESPLQYTIRKIRRLYPEYVIVFIIAFILKSKLWLKEDIVDTIMNAISELLMIHSIGIYSSTINPPSWYICVLLVGGALVYSCIYINRKLSINLLFPVVILLSYTYLLGFNGSLEQFEVDGFISQPLLRGVAGMSLGCMIAAFIYKFKEILRRTVLLDIAILLSVGIVFISLFSHFNYDKFSLIAFVILIISTEISDSLIYKCFKSPLWLKLGGITYEMLLVHAPVIWVLNFLTKHWSTSWITLLILTSVYVIIVLVFSCVLKGINRFLASRINIS